MCRMDEFSAGLPAFTRRLSRREPTVFDSPLLKTVILISQRLSTTVGADRIYMFDGGRLIETGSHRELMTQNGKYAEIFKTQAEKYTR